MIGKITKRVIIESPYRGDIRLNKAYACLAMLDSIMRGEAPFASHLLYTQMLDDNDPHERGLGIALGFAWHGVADLIAYYIDLGMSEGMTLSRDSLPSNKPTEYRRIAPDDLTKLLNARSR